MVAGYGIWKWRREVKKRMWKGDLCNNHEFVEVFY